MFKSQAAKTKCCKSKKKNHVAVLASKRQHAYGTYFCGVLFEFRTTWTGSRDVKILTLWNAKPAYIHVKWNERSANKTLFRQFPCFTETFLALYCYLEICFIKKCVSALLCVFVQTAFASLCIICAMNMTKVQTLFHFNFLLTFWRFYTAKRRYQSE